MGYTGGGNATSQGRPEYEALVGRQEAEIRLLEAMRRCVTSKLKCDREYAASLSAVCAQGLKCGSSSGGVQTAVGGAGDAAPPGGSLVSGAWRRLLDELDGASRAIRAVCDRIEKHTLDRIAGICAEKRKAKKAYQDEYNRISQQYHNVSPLEPFLFFFLLRFCAVTPTFHGASGSVKICQLGRFWDNFSGGGGKCPYCPHPSNTPPKFAVLQTCRKNKTKSQ